MNLLKRLKVRRSMPLSVRLGITLLLITAVSMGVLTTGLIFGVSSYESHRRAGELERQADFYQAFAGELVAGNGDLQGAAFALVKHSVGGGGVAVRVFGSAGQIFSATGPAAPFPSRAVAPLLSSAFPQILLSEDPDRRYSARRIEWNGRLLGVVEVSQSLSEEKRLYALLNRVARQSTSIALLAALIGAAIVARWIAASNALGHELRTPLMALGGYLENLEDAPPGPEQEKAIAAMQAEVARLGRLADELLRTDTAPAISINPDERVDLGRLAEELVTNLTGRATRSGVALSANLPPEPLVICGSQDRLKQALINLLDNALRSTPPGGAITITGRRGPEQIELEVQDTGPGVAPQLREAVWERGVRGADGGSGLGLAIVRTIVQAHGGSAQLAPTDHGAHFILTFPQHQPVAAEK